MSEPKLSSGASVNSRGSVDCVPDTPKVGRRHSVRRSTEYPRHCECARIAHQASRIFACVRFDFAAGGRTARDTVVPDPGCARSAPRWGRLLGAGQNGQNRPSDKRLARHVTARNSWPWLIRPGLSPAAGGVGGLWRLNHRSVNTSGNVETRLISGSRRQECVSRTQVLRRSTAANR